MEIKKTLENLANAIYMIAASITICCGCSIVAWFLMALLIKLLRDYWMILIVALSTYLIALDASHRIGDWWRSIMTKREKEKNTILLDGYADGVYYSTKTTRAWA